VHQAKAGQVLVSERGYAAIEGSFHAEPFGELTLKGSTGRCPPNRCFAGVKERHF
jgi:class 3 adenylate cyclase